MTRILLHIIPAIILLFATSCGEKKLPLQLTEINSIADSISGANAPEDLALFRKADSLLSSVDVSRLSENDRMYHSLLRVKLTDKAYLRHPGDTIIRPVVEYAEKHRRCGFLPEALYYGGRVYSDIGDSFTALRYYQDALDNLPDEKRNLNLRCRLLSQTSYLLNSLRLYKEAIPYLEECIAINKELKDSTNLFYNTQKLGENLMQFKQYDKAENVIRESLKYSVGVPRDDSLTSIVYLAGVKEAKNKIDSAFFLIRGIPEQVNDSLTRNMVLAYASDIYRKAGINDTALIYAREIVKNGNPNNKLIGYQNLLKPENIAFIPTDSLADYVRSYAREMERDLNANGNKLAIIQQAQYNYSIHDRQRREEEERATRYYYLGIALFACAAGAYIYLLRFKRKRKAQLEDANFKIEYLIEQLEREKLEKERQREEQQIMQNLEKEREEKLRVANELLTKTKIENDQRIREIQDKEKQEKDRIVKELLDKQMTMTENMKKQLQEKDQIINDLLEVISLDNEHLEKKKFENERLTKMQVEIEWQQKNNSLQDAKMEKSLKTNIIREKYLKFGQKIAEEKQSYVVPGKILNSEAYKRMIVMIEEGKNLSEYKKIWTDLDEVILKVSPKYKTDLSLLMGGRINNAAWQTVILIKCGFSPSDMSKALKITPGSVADRRINISEKIFGRNVGTDVIDAIIHAL